MTTVEFTGAIPFRISGQKALPVWMQKALQDHLANGENGDGSLRFQCRIAQDANEVFDIFETPTGVFQINPKGKAQFGRNKDGKAFLTVGVIHTDTGDRYRLQWEGENIPLKLMEAAVKHDGGKAVRAMTIPLQFSDAHIRKLGTKSDHRPPRNAEKNANPKSGGKRRHDRICLADVLKETDSRKALASA